MLEIPPVTFSAFFTTVKEAAAFLGVSPATLRNWDRSGKLIPVRDPLNGYRLYRREVLTALLETLHTRRPRYRRACGVSQDEPERSTNRPYRTRPGALAVTQ
jgi:hypothetical protein